MLINAVIVWLRETLPLLVLLSVLLAIWPSHKRLLAGLGVLGGVVLVGLMSSQLRTISGWLDGQGLELSYSLLYIGCALLLALAVACRPQAAAGGRMPWHQHGTVMAALAWVCLCGVHGHNLMLYVWVYPHPETDHANLWLGSALGSGIGGSIAVLLYVAVLEGARWWRWWPALLLALLTARQCAAAVAIWLQSGWLTATETLWDSSGWVDEQSEYGNFLNALLGYEATPDPKLLAVQLLCLLTMLWHCRHLEN